MLRLWGEREYHYPSKRVKVSCFWYSKTLNSFVQTTSGGDTVVDESVATASCLNARGAAQSKLKMQEAATTLPLPHSSPPLFCRCSGPFFWEKAGVLGKQGNAKICINTSRPPIRELDSGHQPSQQLPITSMWTSAAIRFLNLFRRVGSF